jgi:hypothetical protein
VDTNTVWRVKNRGVFDRRGRPRTARAQSWNKVEWIDNFPHDVTPEPGNTYTHETWPPRGRGRGESLYSVRRIAAKLRAIEVIRLHGDGLTWQTIAAKLGFADASGPYRAYRRTLDRLNWNERRAHELQQWHG